jgi:Type III restriction enzyme, res subunit
MPSRSPAVTTSSSGAGGRNSQRVDAPRCAFLASAKDVKGGIAGVVGKEAGLFEDLLASSEQRNEVVNQLRDEVRRWREAGYPGTAIVTRRLLEWWFEREEERKATAKRFFFCQREAVETVIYLYEVQGQRKMPETCDLLRYALKLATGTGKTVVMALFISWSTLHKHKVSGSSLSGNFLVLVPNITVRDRVEGTPRGDGLDPTGEQNLYDGFDIVPPEYREAFRPNVMVRNWQGFSSRQNVTTGSATKSLGTDVSSPNQCCVPCADAPGKIRMRRSAEC